MLLRIVRAGNAHECGREFPVDCVKPVARLQDRPRIGLLEALIQQVGASLEILEKHVEELFLWTRVEL